MEMKKHLLVKGSRFETPYYVIHGNSKGKSMMLPMSDRVIYQMKIMKGILAEANLI